MSPSALFLDEGSTADAYDFSTWAEENARIKDELIVKSEEIQLFRIELTFGNKFWRIDEIC